MFTWVAVFWLPYDVGPLWASPVLASSTPSTSGASWCSSCLRCSRFLTTDYPNNFFETLTELLTKSYKLINKWFSQVFLENPFSSHEAIPPTSCCLAALRFPRGPPSRPWRPRDARGRDTNGALPWGRRRGISSGPGWNLRKTKNTKVDWKQIQEKTPEREIRGFAGVFF